MARISKDYDSHTKDDLLAEAQSRNIQGINTSSLKADIIAALELDDDDTPAQPREPLPPLKASNLPQVKTPEIPPAPGDAPKDEDYNDGVFTKDDGEDYAVAIVDDAPNGRTHWAKNSAHTWNGTEAEFKAQFTKN